MITYRRESIKKQRGVARGKPLMNFSRGGLGEKARRSPSTQERGCAGRAQPYATLDQTIFHVTILLMVALASYSPQISKIKKVLKK